MDCSPPGSSVHGISQARILEWIAISFSRGYSCPCDQTHISCFGRQILYHRATREALGISYCQLRALTSTIISLLLKNNIFSILVEKSVSVFHPSFIQHALIEQLPDARDSVSLPAGMYKEREIDNYH